MKIQKVYQLVSKQLKKPVYFTRRSSAEAVSSTYQGEIEEVNLLIFDSTSEFMEWHKASASNA